MFSITVYSRPFTVNHKAGDCRSARPSKTTHLCSLWGRLRCTQLHGDGVTMPRGPAEPQHLQTFTRATHNPFPVGLKQEKDRPYLPTPLPPHASFSPGLLLEGPLLSRSCLLAPSPPTASSKGLCQVPLLSLGGHLAHRYREQVEAGCPSMLFPARS